MRNQKNECKNESIIKHRNANCRPNPDPSEPLPDEGEFERCKCWSRYHIRQGHSSIQTSLFQLHLSICDLCTPSQWPSVPHPKKQEPVPLHLATLTMCCIRPHPGPVSALWSRLSSGQLFGPLVLALHNDRRDLVAHLATVEGIVSRRRVTAAWWTEAKSPGRGAGVFRMMLWSAVLRCLARDQKRNHR